MLLFENAEKREEKLDVRERRRLAEKREIWVVEKSGRVL
jgi:hypothetical protein